MRILASLASALALCSAGGCLLHSGSPAAVSVKAVRVDHLDELPVLREWPAAASPESLRTAEDSAPVTVQVVLDTAGRVMKELILDLSSPQHELRGPAKDVLTGATFSRPRVHGEPRRALVEVTIDLGRRTATVSPSLSERIAWLSDMVDERPKVVSGPDLVYPANSRRNGITGQVLVQAIIDTTGRAEPASVRIVKGVNSELNQSALYYVNNATFVPARISGRPVRTLVNLPIDFLIRGRR